MSAQDNAALAQRLYALWNSRGFEEATTLLAPGFVLHNMATGQMLEGQEGFLTFGQGWSTAFPDGVVTVERIVAGDDGAAIHFVGRGTHTGILQTPMGEVPPTGRSLDLHFCDLHTIEGGLITETWSFFDAATMMQQLGLMGG